MQKGDILVRGNDKIKVLATLEELVFVSRINYFEVADAFNYTKQQLEEMGWKVEAKKFVPEFGQGYWCVVSDGRAMKHQWTDDSIDHFRLSIGNVHRTEAECEAWKAKLLKKMSEE